MPATLVVVIVTALIGAFSMISVIVWAENRRKERESLHQHQTYQKMLDSGSSADTLVAFMQDQRIDGVVIRRGRRSTVSGWAA